MGEASMKQRATKLIDGDDMASKRKDFVEGCMDEVGTDRSDWVELAKVAKALGLYSRTTSYIDIAGFFRNHARKVREARQMQELINKHRQKFGEVKCK